MADLKITADVSDIQVMRRELLGVAKDAKTSASVFDREFRKVERQMEQTARANQQYYNEVLKIDRATKSAANSASVFERALESQERAAEQLRRKYIPLYAASKDYERQLEEINRANREGILNDAQRAAALQRLNQQFQGLNTTGRGNIKINNDLGVAIQQTGYQVGDFLVQVQSGTNFLVAFGQQATQLVGVLPLVASRLGMTVMTAIGLSTALGIAIPLVTAIGAAFMRTRGEVEDFGKTAAESIDKLKKKLDELRGVDRRADEFEREIAALQARYNAEQELLNDLITSEENLGQQSTVRSDKQREKIAEVSRELLLQKKQYEEYKRILAEIEVQEQRNKAVENIRELREEIGQSAASMLEFAGVDIAKPVSDALKEAAVLADKMDISLEQAIKFNATNMSSGVSAAAKAAAELAKQMNISLRAAMAMMGMIQRGPGFKGDAGDPRAAAGDSPEQAMARRLARVQELMDNPPEFDYRGFPSTSGSRGGGAQAGDRIGALAQSLATEKEILEQWYQDSLVQLSEFNSKELELLGGHAEAKERLEQEHQDRLAAIEQAAQQRKLSETAGLFGALASIASTGGKKMTKVAATFGAIEATINAYKGATAALADPNISVAGRLAAYASVLAAGLKGVAAIRQAGGIGGGSGGSGGGGVITTPTAAAASPQRVLIEGIGPNDLITGSQLSEIFDRLYEENENRGLVFQIAS